MENDQTVPDGEMQKVAEQMNLDRTEMIFDSLIERSKVNDKNLPLGEDALRQVRAVISSGNLHIKTATTKLSALRFSGYREQMGKLKLAVQKRAKNSLRPEEQ